MKNTLEYKGYVGSVELSEEAGAYFSSTRGIRSLISYEGTNARGVEVLYALSHNQTLNSFIKEAVEEKLAAEKR
ncbi:MAG: antitoxin HicB [Lachnospiraceae bacterium]|nr:antitoxin HicB [Lachnospiraceae bacterium]